LFTQRGHLSFPNKDDTSHSAKDLSNLASTPQGSKGLYDGTNDSKSISLA